MYISARFYHRTHVQHAVDACMYIIAHNGAQFPASGINQYALYHHLDIGTIMPQVRHLRPCTEIAIRTYDTIAYI